MKLEHQPPEKIKQAILKIIGKYLDLKKYKVFFFGSRVTGKSNERSDIDVGIEGQEPVSSYAMLEIQEEIEALPTLYKIEVVDFARVTPKFKGVAKEHIEMITK